MSAILTFILLGADPSVATSAELSSAQRLAPLYSLLLPGTGELIRGYKVKGEIFLWVDGITAAGVAGFGWDASGKRRASIYSAIMHAHANPDNRSHKYLAAMEGFLSSGDYNQGIAREARALYEKDLTKQLEYIEKNSFVEEDAWVWETDSLRLSYLEERNDMRRAWQTSQALMGLMLLTRVVSAFDAGFFSEPKESKFGLGISVDPHIPGIQLVYRFQ
ncbi:hypothetical protein JXM67_00560 [candidate division WOR-3 bacterium]|nr:hypothetical protein [candidate division WOR-3 bacterium]